MMRHILIAIMMLAFVACESEATEKENTQTKEKMTSEVINLTGKTLEYNYGDYIYHLNFKTDDTLHWKCVEGDEKGKEADETYTTQRLNDHTLFISWVEADGLGVSQVVNLKENTINCYLKIDREIIPLSGTIREL